MSKLNIIQQSIKSEKDLLEKAIERDNSHIEIPLSKIKMGRYQSLCLVGLLLCV